MMINIIPVVGWILSLLVNASLAVPFWLCWTVCGIGKGYFQFLPEQWQSIPFWDCVGIFMVVTLIRCKLFPMPLKSLIPNDGDEKTGK